MLLHKEVNLRGASDHFRVFPALFLRRVRFGRKTHKLDLCFDFWTKIVRSRGGTIEINSIAN